MAHTQRPKDANFVPMPRRHALLTALALLLACALAPAPTAAQRTSSDKDGNLPSRTAPPSFSAPMVVLLVALITAFFFIGLFSVYIRHCGRDIAFSSGPTISAAALLALSRRQQQQQSGLDDAVVASFPTMKYAEAKELRVGGEDAALECAVCLSEFDDDELLRFLPKCSHAFHPDCIGEWLSGHVTCPVCRCNLEPEDPTSPDTNSADDAGVAQQEVAIDVNREGAEEEERRREAMDLERIGSQRRAVRSQSGRPLARSHSTGHSVAVRLDGDLERFTLRLPEHVRRGMVALGEESLRRSGRIVRRGGARSARLGRSDRWPSFISRTFSSRVPFWAASRRTADAEGAGEGSTASAARVKRTAGTASSGPSAKGSVRFDCLGGGGGGGGVSGARVGAVAGDEEGEEKAFARQV